MNEQAQTPQPTPANTPNGDIAETASVIERSDVLVKRMEEANKVASELLARQEALFARQQLSGRSGAGGVTKTKAELDSEMIAERVKRNIASMY